ncbi:hypothetical protein J3R82DRAFT_2369 [Butyriboletus roseoflavus]|nr:hypothetical protein J3R82DRAFT_2369 [Butyriboletus roseoflavus]
MIICTHERVQAGYLFAISVYISVTIPCLRTIVTPVEVDTMDDRVNAMKILSAGNTIMMLALGAILGLQASPNSRRPICSSGGATPSDARFSSQAGYIHSRGVPVSAPSAFAKAARCFLGFGGQEYARRIELKGLAKLEKVEKEEAVRSTSDKDKKE